MQAQQNNIDELFKNALDNFEQQPLPATWLHIEDKLIEKATTKRKIRMYQIAASVAVLLGVGIGMYSINQQQGDVKPVVAQIQPGRKLPVISQQLPIKSVVLAVKNKPAPTVPKQEIAVVIPANVFDTAVVAIASSVIEESSPLLTEVSYLEPVIVQEEGIKKPINKRNDRMLINKIISKIDKRDNPFLKVEKRTENTTESMVYALDLGFIKVKKVVN